MVIDVVESKRRGLAVTLRLGREAASSCHRETLQTVTEAFHPRQVNRNLTRAVRSNRHQKAAMSEIVMRGQPCIACGSVDVTDKQRGQRKPL